MRDEKKRVIEAVNAAVRQELYALPPAHFNAIALVWLLGEERLFEIIIEHCWIRASAYSVIRRECTSLRSLLQAKPKDLLSKKGFGQGSLRDLQDLLRMFDLRLGMTESEIERVLTGV